jgi:hypothetical protein
VLDYIRRQPILITVKPTKPIESATILVVGDPPVGIHHTSLNVELWMDPTMLEDKDVGPWIEKVRSHLVAAYEEMSGSRCRVMFDYETAAEREQEDQLDAMMGAPHGHEMERA